MANSKILLLVVLTITVSTINCFQVSKPSSLNPPCGTEFTAPSGSILYKPLEQVNPYERCAWIIAVPGAVRYNINLQYLGAPTNEPDSGQELTLTGVARGPTLTTYMPNTTGTFTMTNTAIVIVTFHSSEIGETGSTGYALRYDIVKRDTTDNAESRTHHLLGPNIFRFKYPVSGTNYPNNDLAVFVFSTTGTYHPGKPSDLLYERSGLGSNTGDFLTPYIYNISAPEGNTKWQEYGAKMYYNSPATRKIQHDDMTLIIFQSDASTVSTGFWFSYMSC